MYERIQGLTVRDGEEVISNANDIFIGDNSPQRLQDLLTQLTESSPRWGLVITTDKIRSGEKDMPGWMAIEIDDLIWHK